MYNLLLLELSYRPMLCTPTMPIRQLQIDRIVSVMSHAYSHVMTIQKSAVRVTPQQLLLMCNAPSVNENDNFLWRRVLLVLTVKHTIISRDQTVSCYSQEADQTHKQEYWCWSTQIWSEQTFRDCTTLQEVRNH